MSALRFASLAIIASICAASSVAAAESSYVYCDNGLRYFKAPCPSYSALDLTTGAITKGLSIDVSGLPQQDKAITDLSEALYAGKIVVRGVIGQRTQTIVGRNQNMPWLVATRILRAAKDSERKHCSSH
ncbi:hypothetical protein [Mesorhizobium sp. ES1-1]|uniref:hypothetical protein n=1 Tax=Mesorhizobium sp. ES1-1 TaxID=2876629 RepID=UPI001CCF2101|nr:hypothetical protein [Mesorhizobium sp. ES1-1]MBZ9677319.1 hypothetical protein [Mesorhizobium sp. ES1-1]